MQPPVDQQEWDERIKKLYFPKAQEFLASFHGPLRKVEPGDDDIR